MALLINESAQQLVTNTHNESKYIVPIATFMRILDTIETAFADKKATDPFWAGACAGDMLKNATYWAFRGAYDEAFDIPEHFASVIQAVVGWSNDGNFDIALELGYTKNRFFTDLKINERQAQVLRLQNFGKNYGAKDGMSVGQAIIALNNMDRESSAYQNLTEDAQTKMEARNTKVDKAWEDVMKYYEKNQENAITQDFNDVPEGQLYHMTQDIARMFGNVADSARNKADFLDLADSERDTKGELNRKAGATVILDTVNKAIAIAEEIDKSNVNEEVIRDLEEEHQNLDVPDGFEHKDYNEGYVTP